MATNRFIELVPEFQDRYLPNVIDGYRFRLTAVASGDVTPKIFLYQERPIAPSGVTSLTITTGVVTRVAEFISVCSPADIAEYPEDAPGPDDDPAFFRHHQVDVVFRSKHEADEMFDLLIFEVRKLIETLDIMDELSAAPPLIIGNPPT